MREFVKSFYDRLYELIVSRYGTYTLPQYIGRVTASLLYYLAVLSTIAIAGRYILGRITMICSF